MNNGCQQCKYFMNGECRVNPPSENGFPKVEPTDWCGKFALDKFSNNEELCVDGRTLLNE